MSDLKTGHVAGTSQNAGNAIVVTLVVLLAVAAGALAYVSGMINIPSKGEKSSVETAEAEEQADPNPVVARVDGKEIKREDVLVFINQMPPQLRQIPPQQLFAMALEQSIGNIVVDRQVKKSDIKKDPDVKEQLQNAKQQILRTNFLQKTVEAKITNELVQGKYDTYVQNFPKVDEVRASHILVEDEKAAKSVIKKLGNGSDFAELAKENSKDGSAQNGGDLGYFSKADVVAPFAEAAFATNVGEYTKAPVKSEFGYHVISVTDKRVRPAPTLEQATPFIKQELQREILDELVSGWSEEVEIERFDINGNPLPASEEPAAGEEAATDAAVDADAVSSETPAEEKPAE